MGGQLSFGGLNKGNIETKEPNTKQKVQNNTSYMFQESGGV